MKGYQQALEEYNLPSEILKLDNEPKVNQVMYDYLKEHNKIDAIISNDHVTGIVAINMARRLGRKIPDDISVIGFGYENTQIISSPKISIIHQKAFEIGEMSIKLLIENLSNEAHELQTIVVPSELKLSGSTKKA